VAAAADHHFRVAKEVRGGTTHTQVSQLRDTQARWTDRIGKGSLLIDCPTGTQVDASKAIFGLMDAEIPQKTYCT